VLIEQHRQSGATEVGFDRRDLRLDGRVDVAGLVGDVSAVQRRKYRL
jgi:hypothetical protein